MQEQAFQRIELKYLVSKVVADKFIRAITPFTTIDPHAQTSLDHTYNVHSIYFDSPSLKYFYEKMHGIKKREKLRLRAYGDINHITKSSPIYAELKRKNDLSVDKIRFSTTLDKFFRITKKINNEKLSNTEKLFSYTYKKNGLRPTNIVSYKRQARFSKKENFRITIDSEITSKNLNNINFIKNQTKVLPHNKKIIEIKFEHSLPFWLHNLIQSYNLDRTTYSKYCESLIKTKPALNF